ASTRACTKFGIFRAKPACRVYSTACRRKSPNEGTGCTRCAACTERDFVRGDWYERRRSAGTPRQSRTARALVEDVTQPEPSQKTSRSPSPRRRRHAARALAEKATQRMHPQGT